MSHIFTQCSSVCFVHKASCYWPQYISEIPTFKISFDSKKPRGKQVVMTQRGQVEKSVSEAASFCHSIFVTVHNRLFHKSKFASWHESVSRHKCSIRCLTFWRRNYFFLNFSSPCIQNVNNTGTKYVRIMKRTAFWREKKTESIHHV